MAPIEFARVCERLNINTWHCRCGLQYANDFDLCLPEGISHETWLNRFRYPEQERAYWKVFKDHHVGHEHTPEYVARLRMNRLWEVIQSRDPIDGHHLLNSLTAASVRGEQPRYPWQLRKALELASGVYD